jgi:hypothetical protein
MIIIVKSLLSKTFLVITLMLCIRSAHAALKDVDIIVNEKNPNTSIKASELTDYFMKKARKWPNGDSVRFFDFRDENEIRSVFLKKFVKKTSREIELYWIGEKIYTGNIAPIQITNDSMMTAMVSRFPGGIGYINTKGVLPKTVKRLTIVQD